MSLFLLPRQLYVLLTITFRVFLPWKVLGRSVTSDSYSLLGFHFFLPCLCWLSFIQSFPWKVRMQLVNLSLVKYIYRVLFPWEDNYIVFESGVFLFSSVTHLWTFCFRILTVGKARLICFMEGALVLRPWPEQSFYKGMVFLWVPEFCFPSKL